MRHEGTKGKPGGAAALCTMPRRSRSHPNVAIACIAVQAWPYVETGSIGVIAIAAASSASRFIWNNTYREEKPT